MARQNSHPRRESKTRRRRGRQPNDHIFADLDSILRARVNRLAEKPWLSGNEIYNLMGLRGHGLNQDTFRKEISKTRSRLGIRCGLHGPRTLKHRADLFATSLLEHLATNHPDEFVSAVLKRLCDIHLRRDEREEEGRR